MRSCVVAMAISLAGPAACGGGGSIPPTSIESGLVVSCEWAADVVVVPFIPGGGGPTTCEVAVAPNETVPSSASEASETWFIARNEMNLAILEIDGHGELALGEGVWTTCTSPNWFGSQCATFAINELSPVVTVRQVSSGAGVHVEFISNTTGDRLETHDIFVADDDVDRCVSQTQRERGCSGDDLVDNDIRDCVSTLDYVCEDPQMPQVQAEYWNCRASGECVDGAWSASEACSGDVPECPAEE